MSEGNTRAGALGAIKHAEGLVRDIPEVLTVSAVLAIVRALLAVCEAMRCTVRHVDAIE